MATIAPVGHVRALRRPCRLPRHDPPDRARAGRAAGGGDRRQGRVPVGPAQAVRRAGPARAALRRGVRRHRHRHADAQHRGRGDLEGVRLDRPDPDGAGARDAPDPAVRHRRAQAALPAEVRERRVVARLRAVGARGGLGPGRDAHHRASATATSGSSTARRTGSPTSASPTSTSSSRSRTARAGASPPSSSRPTGPASASASSSTSSASRARRPASRSSRTSASRTRT